VFNDWGCFRQAPLGEKKGEGASIPPRRKSFKKPFFYLNGGFWGEEKKNNALHFTGGRGGGPKKKILISVRGGERGSYLLIAGKGRKTNAVGRKVSIISLRGGKRKFP